MCQCKSLSSYFGISIICSRYTLSGPWLYSSLIQDGSGSSFHWDFRIWLEELMSFYWCWRASALIFFVLRVSPPQWFPRYIRNKIQNTVKLTQRNHVKNHKPGIDLSVKCIAEVFLLFLLFSVFLFCLRRLLTKKNSLVLLYFYVNFFQILFIRMKFDTVNCGRHHSE